ncbi:MAG: helix-turn-helix transcriptional regulator [Bacteroidota bacterium]
MSEQGSLSGGKILKGIRERQGISQQKLGSMEVITQANLSRIEGGKSIPARETLEDILDAIQASFNERQQVLTSFGYLAPYPLPNAQEIEAACTRCQLVLDSVPMPAYLMDFVTRFFAWNPLFAKLLGIYEESDVLEGMRNQPLFKSQFDSNVHLAQEMEHMEEYLLAEMLSIRQRLAPYTEEGWYAEFVAQLCESEQFRHYWEATEGMTLDEDIVTEFAARVLNPVQFEVPGPDTEAEDLELRFYANLDALIGDDRFSIVYLIPSDAMTIRQIDRWLVEG